MVSRMDGIDGGIGAIVGGWGWFWLGSSGGMTILNQPALLGDNPPLRIIADRSTALSVNCAIALEYSRRLGCGVLGYWRSKPGCSPDLGQFGEYSLRFGGY